MQYDKSYMTRKADRFAAESGSLRSGGLRLSPEHSRCKEPVWNFHFCPAYFPLVGKARGSGSKKQIS